MAHRKPRFNLKKSEIKKREPEIASLTDKSRKSRASDDVDDTNLFDNEKMVNFGTFQKSPHNEIF